MDIIGKIIKDQIKSIDLWALQAYGATDFSSLEETNQREGGLSFQVSGLHLKGTVLIELTWRDEYKISFIREDGTIQKEIDHVFCDQLVDVLDYIEHGD